MTLILSYFWTSLKLEYRTESLQGFQEWCTFKMVHFILFNYYFKVKENMPFSLKIPLSLCS